MIKNKNHADKKLLSLGAKLRRRFKEILDRNCTFSWIESKRKTSNITAEKYRKIVKINFDSNSNPSV